MQKFADRVKETTTTVGTGSYSLGGAVAGAVSFATAFANGNTVYYCCEDGLNWEVGIGTLTSGSPWTMARTTVIASSNAGAAVSWSAGAKSIYNTLPASGVLRPTVEGISFGNSNLPGNVLDWYEEGTWTPTITNKGGTGSITTLTYTGQSGIFTRIGNQVTAHFRIDVNAFTVGAANGTLVIDGLPYAVAQPAVGSCFTSGVDLQGTSGAVILWPYTAGGTDLSLYVTTDNAAFGTGPISGLSAGDVLIGSITYKVSGT